MAETGHRIIDYLTLTEFAVGLHNSNPENLRIDFTVDQIVNYFAQLKTEGISFIVGGYLAAAYYGLQRASPEIELFVRAEYNSLPPFQIRIAFENFDGLFDNTVEVELATSTIRILSLQDLIEDFKNSENLVKPLDAPVLQELVLNLKGYEVF